MSLLLCLLRSQYIIWRYYAVYRVLAHFYGAVVSVTISYRTIFMLRKKDTPHGHVMPSMLMAGSQCTVSKLMKEGTFTSSILCSICPQNVYPFSRKQFLLSTLMFSPGQCLQPTKLNACRLLSWIRLSHKYTMWINRENKKHAHQHPPTRSHGPNRTEKEKNEMEVNSSRISC